ncbi:hypothetical protein [Frigoriflavimonas asaccharolytica]|uniref:hypothetical protein n=1 Tax=Frigoriflavimonas asaccharolytica TaxID=2735899 RepID=UPI0036D26304
MKTFAALVLSIILLSCKTTTIAAVETENLERYGDCVENLTFKKKYFENISKVDSLMNVGASRLGKDKSLGFISTYTYVDWASMANYSRSYTGGAYEKDRKGWILWYDLKKCINIQFKK